MAAGLAGLLAHKRPVDSNNTLIRETFQRLGKDEITPAFSPFEADDSEVRPAVALLNCHDPTVLYLRLEMTIGSRLLPQSINLRDAAFFDHLRKARRFDFKQFHNSWDKRVPPSSSLEPSLLHQAKSPPENYGKKDQTTVAAFLPWRDLSVLNP